MPLVGSSTTGSFSRPLMLVLRGGLWGSTHALSSDSVARNLEASSRDGTTPSLPHNYATQRRKQKDET